MSKPAESSSSQQQVSESTRPTLNGNQSYADNAKPKKKRWRHNKNKKRDRRQSFAAAGSESGAGGMEGRPSLLDVPDPDSSAQQHSLYRLQRQPSNTSLESEALLDHRGHGKPSRRLQTLEQGFSRPSLAVATRGSGKSTPRKNPRCSLARNRSSVISDDEDGEQDGDEDADDKTPLLSSSRNNARPTSGQNTDYGSQGQQRPRRSSAASKTSRLPRMDVMARSPRNFDEEASDYDVNNPPSMPGSPKLGSLDDLTTSNVPGSQSSRGHDAVITIDGDYGTARRVSQSESPEMRRRSMSVAELAERDVCFPADAGLSEIGEEDERHSTTEPHKVRRKRARQWPDFDVMEQWACDEKEERTHQDQIRVKKISEPVMVGGRLRPGKTIWHREEDDAPFRFTYFNELMDSTIHARTLSDLQQEGHSFQDLFVPEAVELADSDSENESAAPTTQRTPAHPSEHEPKGLMKQVDTPTRKKSPASSTPPTGQNTPKAGRDDSQKPASHHHPKPKHYGARPTFWLDVLRPTEDEMKVLARAFGIHQLTVEDILMEEQREKVELFQNYYFVNYRSFEQDENSENYLEPVNIYIIVFREGVLSFHHSMTPHPANVRRRVRQLNDYMSPSADWISYAIIDDVTDVYLPLVQQIEKEVDTIDDCILDMHESSADDTLAKSQTQAREGGKKKHWWSISNKETQGDVGAEKMSQAGDRTTGESGGDMLRRVGESRKKVMSLYRLLGNKADVIKGFAKRCNEHWQVAPKSEIGLYLGDIQDHIVTMTANLSHYEK